MGAGHGRHSKRPDHGASPAHVVDELRSALLALRDVKKALARAETRFRQVPPAVMNENQWAWALQAPMESAQQQAASLRATIDRALSHVPGDGRAPPRAVSVSPGGLPAGGPPAPAILAPAEGVVDYSLDDLRRAVDEQIRGRQHRGSRTPKDF